MQFTLPKILGALERVTMWVRGAGGEHGDSREICPLQSVKILGSFKADSEAETGMDFIYPYILLTLKTKRWPGLVLVKENDKLIHSDNH